MSAHSHLNKFDTPEDAHQLIALLQAKLVETVPIEQGASAYALLDFPYYPNVGDSLIWLGAEKFLREQYRDRARYICTVEGFNPHALKRSLPHGPIYLSGGGNFGDLWPKFQKFRLEVLRNFPDRQVIQLPQTIHFADKSAVEETRKAIREHGQFFLMVRDLPSKTFAEDVLGCDAVLAPDMAFWLGALQRQRAPEYHIASMLRKDKEQNANRGDLKWPEGVTVNSFDWIHGSEEGLGSRLWYRAIKRQKWLGEFSYFRSRARYQLDRGVSLLGSGECVLTDRLHGHILSVLLGIPNVILDNSYGKIRNFHELWTSKWSGCALVESLDDAYPALVNSLGKSDGSPR